jgi:hypothetical protein
MASQTETFIRNKALYELCPKLRSEDNKLLFTLLSITRPYSDNRDGNVCEATLAEWCNRHPKSITRMLKKLKKKAGISWIPTSNTCWTPLATNYGILFHLPPLFVINKERTAVHLDSKESPNLESFSGNTEKGTSNTEKGTSNTEKGTSNTEKGTSNTEKGLEYHPDNWVQIPHEVVRDPELTGNAIFIYAIMLTHNTHCWTPIELQTVTKIGTKQFYKAISSLRDKNLITQTKGWQINSPNLKEFPRNIKNTPPKPLPTKQSIIPSTVSDVEAELLARGIIPAPRK